MQASTGITPLLDYPIKQLQCDHGQEFSFPSCWGSKPLGSGIGTSGPGARNRNGKVERSHRIDQQEFWGRHRFPDFEAAAGALGVWETTYNYQRFSLALRGRTPAEKLAALRPPLQAA